jgi:hypothetical protein
MARCCIALVVAVGRETGDARRAPAAAQASIDAFFDGESSVFSLDPCPTCEDAAPESAAQPAMPLAPAA